MRWHQCFYCSPFISVSQHIYFQKLLSWWTVVEPSPCDSDMSFIFARDLWKINYCLLLFSTDHLVSSTQEGSWHVINFVYIYFICLQDLLIYFATNDSWRTKARISISLIEKTNLSGPQLFWLCKHYVQSFRDGCELRVS